MTTVKVCIDVADLDEAGAFYCQALQCTEVARNPRTARLTAGGNELYLILRPEGSMPFLRGDRRSGTHTEMPGSARSRPKRQSVLALRDDGDGRMSAMDDYLDGLAPDQQAALARVREIVTGLVPDAEEGKRYGMPAFILAGRPLLGFRAAQRHLSIFPFDPAAIDSVRDRLDGFDLAKGTIRFTADHPLPDAVLVDVVRFRQQQITTR